MQEASVTLCTPSPKPTKPGPKCWPSRGCKLSLFFLRMPCRLRGSSGRRALALVQGGFAMEAAFRVSQYVRCLQEWRYSREHSGIRSSCWTTIHWAVHPWGAQDTGSAQLGSGLSVMEIMLFGHGISGFSGSCRLCVSGDNCLEAVHATTHSLLASVSPNRKHSARRLLPESSCKAQAGNSSSSVKPTALVQDPSSSTQVLV